MINTNTYEPKTATVRARYIALYGQQGALSGCNIEADLSKSRAIRTYYKWVGTSWCPGTVG